MDALRSRPVRGLKSIGAAMAARMARREQRARQEGNRAGRRAFMDELRMLRDTERSVAEEARLRALLASDPCLCDEAWLRPRVRTAA